MIDLDFPVVPALPVRLEFVRDLEAYDGVSLLCEYRAEVRQDDSEPYLYLWCDCDREAGIHRWFVGKSTRSMIAQYLDDKISLRALILSCLGSGWLMETGNEAETVKVWELLPIRLPLSYLPAIDSFHTR